MGVVGNTEDVEAGSAVEIDELLQRELAVAPGRVCVQLAEQQGHVLAGSTMWPPFGKQRGEHRATKRVTLQQLVDVERVVDRDERNVLVARPFLRRSVPGELDADAVGVTQVEGVADAVLGHESLLSSKRHPDRGARAPRQPRRGR
jgi:hypothetical protein